MNLKPNFFKRRLITFYSSWINHRKHLWGNSDVLVVCNPPSDSHPISSAFFIWLFGHDLPDTLAVFSSDEIYFICTDRKSAALQALAGPAMEGVRARVVIRPKDGSDDDGLELMDGIVREFGVLHGSRPGRNRSLVVGYVPGEAPKSKLIWSPVEIVKPVGFRSVRVSGFFTLLNQDQDARYSDKGGLEPDKRCRSSSSRLKGRVNRDVQMHALPCQFEEMLLLAPAGGAPPLRSSGDRKPRLEEEKGDSAVKETEGGSSKSSVVPEEDDDDEWVMV